MSFTPRPKPTIPEDWQESVWDYPRPPAVVKFHKTITIRYEDKLLVKSEKCFKLMEEASPPTYYIPKSDIEMDKLVRIRGKSSYCEWKGKAHYYGPSSGPLRNKPIAWSYQNPNPEYEMIKEHLAFYPQHLDCRINEEKVGSQPGNFYGGWITSNIVGPFKGEPGTGHW